MQYGHPRIYGVLDEGPQRGKDREDLKLKFHMIGDMHFQAKILTTHLKVCGEEAHQI